MCFWHARATRAGAAPPLGFTALPAFSYKGSPAKMAACEILSVPTQTGILLLSTFAPTVPLIACGRLAWTFYDHVLTFHDELNLIWVRYGGLACGAAVLGIYLWPHPSGGLAVVCRAAPFKAEYATPWQNLRQWELTPVLQFTTFWFVEVILQLRVYAILGKRFARFNASIFAVTVCSMLALWADWSTAPGGCDQHFPSPPADFAALENSPAELGCSMFPLYWVPGLLYELWLVALALMHLRRRVLKNDILSVIITDSVMYFLLIAAVMIAHLSLSFIGLGRYAVSFVIASQTIGGSRVVLHLRKRHYLALELSLDSMSSPLVFALRSSLSLADETFCDPGTV
ncbi:hypothetical protein AURDEDRAFT_166115 [Auricularia subglabra TFB-10046 SS5]|nr:hypothetical protein AURDEDRAFT_166115 [Auricularia subglabra TFB-10046 SS5]